MNVRAPACPCPSHGDVFIRIDFHEGEETTTVGFRTRQLSPEGKVLSWSFPVQTGNGVEVINAEDFGSPRMSNDWRPIAWVLHEETSMYIPPDMVLKRDVKRRIHWFEKKSGKSSGRGATK